MTDKSSAKGDHHQRAKLAPDTAGAAHEQLDTARAAGAESAGGSAVCHHGVQRSPALQLVGEEPRPILPSVGTIVQAGAFGAALGGMTTGVLELARSVNQGLAASAAGLEGGYPSSDARAAALRYRQVRAEELVLGSVRHLGIVFGRTAFKVALEQAVKGGLNSLMRVT